MLRSFAQVSLVWLLSTHRCIARNDVSNGVDSVLSENLVGRKIRPTCQDVRLPSSCEDAPALSAEEDTALHGSDALAENADKEPVTVASQQVPGASPLTWAPLPQNATVQRIFIGSCDEQVKPQDFWKALKDKQPDLMVLAGDNVYGDCEAPACHNLAFAYATLSAQQDFRDFVASVPTLAIWDDHDYGINDGDGSWAGKHVAKDLFLEFYGIPSDDVRRTSNRGLHASWILGPPDQRVQVIFMDCRWYRDSMQRTPFIAAGQERYVPDYNASRTMLGEEQWKWLEETLKEPAELRLLVSSTQTLTTRHGWEKWGNFPLERKRLLDTIASASPMPILLSGDRHIGGLYREEVPAKNAPQNGQESGSARGSVTVWEMTASSYTKTVGRISAAEVVDPWRFGAAVLRNNAGAVEIDWKARQVSLTFLQTGNQSHMGSQFGETVTIPF